MQHNKDKKFLSEISDYCKNTPLLLKVFSNLLGQFDLRYINKLFSDTKIRGVKGSEIFQTLFGLRFLDFNNIHQLMQSGISKELGHKKDVFYDFINNQKVNWRSIMGLFFKQAYALITAKSVDNEPNKPRCLIVDDTLLEKSGKTIEQIGKVFDHSTHRYQLGMKLLTLGFSDGKSFMPVDFSLHHEQGKNKKRGMKQKELDVQFTKNRDLHTPGYQRQSEVSQDKITVALQMIKCSLGKWFKVDYVLADSWFICEKFILGIQNISNKLNIIGLIKINRIVVVNGKSYKADKIPDINRKKTQYSNKFKCHFISLKMSCKGIEMRGYWIKMKGQNNWNLLISTNDKLTFIKAMEYYKIRWSIEVFFKDCKQNLGLNNCQSKDLDAHIATISIVFMNYIVLALKKRFEDYETLGILFRNVKEIILQQTIVERIWTIMLSLFDSVFAKMGVDWQRFIQTLIHSQDEIAAQINKTFETLFSNQDKQTA